CSGVRHRSRREVMLSNAFYDWCLWCDDRALWRASDEGEQFGLDIGVIGNVPPWSVLAPPAEQIVQRHHALEHRGALVWIHRLALSRGAGEIPAVHEDVAGVDHVD